MAENLDQSSNRTKKKSIESWSSTNIKLVRLRHTWTINNFSFCSNSDENLESPTFSAETNNGELEWRLNLYQDGEEDTNEEISLYLTLVNFMEREVQAECTLGIVNADGKDVNIVTKFRTFNKDCHNWGKDDFLKINSLFEEVNNYLSDDKLTIFCEITAMVGKDNTSGTFTTPQLDLVKDFAFMFENREWCDVTLSAGGKEFPAHKVILAARSPVFKVMFQHDMEESRNNQVDFTDLDEEVLNEMLRYMYTGEVHKLEEMAPHLLGMADKYAMDGLKIMCEKALLESLSVKNAAETFILSDTFHATNLKKQVKNFIVAHAEEVGKAPGFESMGRTHPNLALEAFCVLSNPAII